MPHNLLTFVMPTKDGTFRKLLLTFGFAENGDILAKTFTAAPSRKSATLKHWLQKES